MVDVNRGQVPNEERRQMARTLGISEAGIGREVSLSELQSAVEPSVDSTFASVGEAIRDDLEGRLDADLLERELSNLADQIRRVPELREAGIPSGETEPEVLYRELVEPGWEIYDHLVEVGFCESVDANVPRFTADNIRNTARELVQAEPLTSALADLGFDEREQAVLVMNVTNNDRRLSRWVPTAQIPEGVEFNVDYVPPLHQRAAGGVLLWTKTMDVHLWQKSVLITDRILDDAAWDVRGMLAGFALMAMAALELADDDRTTLTNSQLTAALTAGAAIMIINQENVCRDAFYITDDVRAPSTAR